MPTPPVAHLVLVRPISRVRQTMSTVALVITCITGLCSFAFLTAGYVALLSQEQSEVADFRRRYEQLSFRGVLAPFQRWMWLRREALPISRVIGHWRTRPEVRRLIWLGLLFFAVALISGHFSSLPR